jgi:hypothetical protein
MNTYMYFGQNFQRNYLYIYRVKNVSNKIYREETCILYPADFFRKYYGFLQHNITK